MNAGKSAVNAWLDDALAKASTLPGKTLVATDEGEFFMHIGGESDEPESRLTLQRYGWKRIEIGGNEYWQHSGNWASGTRDNGGQSAKNLVKTETVAEHVQSRVCNE